MKLVPSKKQWKAWKFPTKLTVIVSYLTIISFIISMLFYFVIKPLSTNTKETNSTTNGPFSPAIVSEGDNNEVTINYNFKGSEENILTPQYELFFQKMKSPPSLDIADQYYEIGFKNITEKPIINFEFTLIFEQPVDTINYEHRRSSSNFTGGSGLSDNKKIFNWRGNQISENGGWVVFLIKTENPPPVISKIYTNVSGIIKPSNEVILADLDHFKK